MYTLPCESVLYVEGRLTSKEKNENMPTLGSNCVAYMFDEIRYELNAMEIDCNRNVGIIIMLKGYASFSGDNALTMLNAGSRVNIQLKN